MRKTRPARVHTNRRPQSLTLGWLLLAALLTLSARTAPALADDPTPGPRAAIQKAKVLHASEQNLAAAIDLLDAVVNDPEASVEHRTEALFELGGLWRHAGDGDRAVLCFRKASEGAGPFAVRAGAVLDGSEAAQAELAERIERLIYNVRGGGERGIEAREQLAYVGEAAVPAIVKTIHAEKVDLYLVQQLIEVLLEIGGPKTGEFIESVAASNDRLFKRFVTQGFRNASRKRSLTGPFQKLLSDPSPDVRAEALGAAVGLLSVDTLIRIASDENARVRTGALVQLADQSRGVLKMPGAMAKLAPAITRSLHSTDQGETTAALEFLRNSFLLSTPAGRSLFLTVLGDADLLESPATARWYPSRSFRNPGGILVLDFDAPPAAEDTLQVARAIQPPWPESRRDALAEFIQRCVDAWDASQMDAVLALVGLGYDPRVRGGLSKYIVRNATAQHAVRVAQHLDELAKPDDVREWLLTLRHDIADLDRMRDLVREKIDRPTDQLSRSVPDLLTFLAQTQHPDIVPVLLEAAERHPEPLFEKVAYALSQVEGEAATQGLHRLVRLDVPGDRTWALLNLAMRGAEEVPEAARDAYARGRITSRRDRSFLVRLVEEGFDSRLSSKETARAFELVLSTGSPIAWEAMPIIYGYSRYETSPEVSRAFLRELAKFHTPSSLFNEFNIAFNHLKEYPEVAPIAALALSTGDARIVSMGITWFYRNPGNPGVIASQETIARVMQEGPGSMSHLAAEVLARTGTDFAREKLREATRHPAHEIRLTAIRSLYAVFRDEPADRLIELLGDAEPEIRRTSAGLLGATLDKSAVGPLLEALRDPDASVRASIQGAVRTIQEYHETRARWAAWVEESERGEKLSTADALMQQAAPDQPEVVRVAAIESLGTVGDPNTLPFLVRLVGDDDPAIAQAARAAIARINGKPAKPKEAPRDD